MVPCEDALTCEDTLPREGDLPCEGSALRSKAAQVDNFSIARQQRDCNTGFRSIFTLSTDNRFVGELIKRLPLLQFHFPVL